ncbi:MAG: hypothetical protein ACLQGU_14740 [bacterium]
MNLPGLPTDNLYKFMALSGIILIISSFYIVWKHSDRSQQLLRELNASLAVENTNSDNRRSDLSDLKLKSEELKFILKEKPWYMTFLLISQFMGLVLSIVGFRLWYLRVQKYQDIILAKQARSLRTDNNSQTK